MEKTFIELLQDEIRKREEQICKLKEQLRNFKKVLKIEIREQRQKKKNEAPKNEEEPKSEAQIDQEELTPPPSFGLTPMNYSPLLDMNQIPKDMVWRSGGSLDMRQMWPFFKK